MEGVIRADAGPLGAQNLIQRAATLGADRVRTVLLAGNTPNRAGSALCLVRLLELALHADAASVSVRNPLEVCRAGSAKGGI